MKLGPKQGRRGAFMLCTLHKTINSMVRYYKSKMCDAKNQAVNYTESINLVDPNYW